MKAEDLAHGDHKEGRRPPLDFLFPGLYLALGLAWVFLGRAERSGNCGKLTWKGTTEKR
jgi:hypothetical protein